jgi:tripartite-type tricarboxylate transporter receptor subunit TctC
LLQAPRPASNATATTKWAARIFSFSRTPDSAPRGQKIKLPAKPQAPSAERLAPGTTCGVADRPRIRWRPFPALAKFSVPPPGEFQLMAPKRPSVRRSRRGALAPMALLVLAAWAASAAPAAWAEDYPARTVKMIVPFPAGGTADALPRIIAEWLSRKWGQSVIIEDRTGAGGNIGAEVVAKSDPDGYTLLASPAPPLVINQNLYPRLDFDPLKFVPIVVIGRVPNALVVNPDRVAANSVKDFIAYAQANPGKVTDATQGNGTTSHLTSELFQMMTHVKLQNVPYRGSAPALNDLVAGSVDCMFDNLGVSMQLIKAGKLKLIAVASAERMTSLPDVPAIAETLPGFAAVAWYAIVAPPGTPAAIAEKINAGVDEALRDADVRQRLAVLSAEPVGGSLAATAAYFREETERWKSVIVSAHVTLD